MKIVMLLFFFLSMALPLSSSAQSHNHHWLLGYLDPPFNAKGELLFTDTNANFYFHTRQIEFFTTQGNYSNRNGILLASSNGQVIANRFGDVMQNGSGLNPTSFTTAYPDGLPIPNANLIIEKPGDSTKLLLFHQTGDYSSTSIESNTFFQTTIDLTLDGGLGDVTNKNEVLLQDIIGFGFAACKHANGRDWWLLVLDDEMEYFHTILVHPNGVKIYPQQNFSGLGPEFYFIGQPTFSPDGTKFAISSADYLWGGIHDIRLFDFDRCTGLLTNPKYISLSDDTLGGFGFSFSSNSKYMYASTFRTIYQLDTDASNIDSSRIAVAVNDTFASPSPPFYTDFFYMYLAANGKIYITSGSSVYHLHHINFPDSAGSSCDVVLHGLNLHMYNFRTYPFHPNYSLEAVMGSSCDSLGVGLPEISHDFNLSVFPNPNNGIFNIAYTLPQNTEAQLEIQDITGRVISNKHLPAWSTLQHIDLKNLNAGVYNCTIVSSKYSQTIKLLISN